jgi:hypothetical protein
LNHNLSFLFIIILLIAGSCFTTFAQTQVVDENINVLSNYTPNLNEHKYSDIENCSEDHFDLIEVSEGKHMAFYVPEEAEFTDRSAPEESSTFELKFFLSMVIFTAFLAVLHFYRKDGRVREYQPFD